MLLLPATAGPDAHVPNRRAAFALLGFALPVIAILILRAWTSASPIGISINEGFNAYQTRTWLETGRMYYPADALIVNNYPPLFFLLTGLLARSGADIVFLGRGLAWAGFLGCGAMVFLIVWRLHRDAIAAGLAALVLLGAQALLYPLHIGTNEPQVLSHFLALCGLYVALGTRTTAGMMGAALLMVVGLFFKHNVIVIPCATGLWLLYAAPRAGLRFAAAGILFSALGIGLCQLAFGPEFAANMLGYRPWDVTVGVQHFLVWGSELNGLLVLAVVALVLARPHAATALFALAIALGAGLGGFMLLSRGVYYSALFELTIALALAIGHAAAGLKQRRTLLIAAAGLAIFVSPDVTDLQGIVRPAAFAARLQARALATSRIVSTLRASPGPALCETLLYCFWAGKPFVVEPFNLSQRVLQRATADAPLLQRIARGDIAIAALDGSPGPSGASLLSPAVWQALQSRFQAINVPDTRTTLFVAR